jgi:hypothetical protein
MRPFVCGGVGGGGGGGNVRRDPAPAHAAAESRLESDDGRAVRCREIYTF